MNEENPFEKKCCYDCAHLKAAVSWWCGNEEAKKWRGTAIPGVHGCPFWSPDWSYIDKKYQTKQFGYTSIGDDLLSYYYNFLGVIKKRLKYIFKSQIKN